MILMVDSLAHRYGLLPSQVLAQATTLDLYVIDASLSYENWYHAKSQGKVADNYTTDELQDILARSRGAAQ